MATPSMPGDPFAEAAAEALQTLRDGISTDGDHR